MHLSCIPLFSSFFRSELGVLEEAHFISPLMLDSLWVPKQLLFSILCLKYITTILLASVDILLFFSLSIHFFEWKTYPDNSGIRIHYTTTPRQYEAGVLTLGMLRKMEWGRRLIFTTRRSSCIVLGYSSKYASNRIRSWMSTKLHTNLAPWYLENKHTHKRKLIVYKDHSVPKLPSHAPNGCPHLDDTLERRGDNRRSWKSRVLYVQSTIVARNKYPA